MASQVVSDGLVRLLSVEDVTWQEVWRRIEKAAKKGMAAELVFNVTHFAYDPESDTVLVGGLTVDDGEACVHIKDFPKVIGPFLGGGPK